MNRPLGFLVSALTGMALIVSVPATAPSASASDNGQSIRPAMGWSSWSFVRRWPDETKMKAQADAMASSGLSGHGFVYVNLDDFYQKCDSNGFVVDSYGRWAVDSAKFPSRHILNAINHRPKIGNDIKQFMRTTRGRSPLRLPAFISPTTYWIKFARAG